MTITTKEMETDIGRWRANGAIEAIGGMFFWGAILIAGILWGFWYFDWLPDEIKDDSDPISGQSGFRIHTDCLTGIQYLSRDGSLIPRLDGQGGHVVSLEGCP